MGFTEQDADLVGVPPDLDLPVDQLYRQTYKKRVIVDLGAHGYLELARQRGIQHLVTKLVNLELVGDKNDIVYVVVRAELQLEGEDKEWNAYGDASTVDSDERPTSVAETRAIRRVVQKALGIRVAKTGQKSQSSPSQGSSGEGEYRRTKKKMEKEGEW